MAQHILKRLRGLEFPPQFRFVEGLAQARASTVARGEEAKQRRLAPR